MFKLAAAALIAAIILCLAAGRRGSPHWLRFALASFGFFGVITAIFWIVSPAGTARTVSDDLAGGVLLLQIVQGRGAVVLPFGLAALFAAWTLPGRRSAAVLGPFAYNLIMSFEALRAQFTPLATPERWIYVGLHSLWAISLAIYCFGLDWRSGRKPPTVAVAIVPPLLGVTLFAAPSLLTGGNQSPMLLHAAHAFGASLIGLGAVSYGFWSGLSGMPGRVLCIMAALLLAAIAFASGYWMALVLALAWGLAHAARQGREAA
ncbi:hypothetical protein ASE00_00425 [Sphingomonas sp. Root710]|uniref:hypothetical protein n=1 Tax=Sphingomonas sp. Root710 TaxID=1736594 RepID=UPI0006F6C014|nr:hypothetical protein [Sphingomonas sp. Root710]KRB85309.1 hypothetical protein ASE00_00425 [Sphingomonas sp. Root710]